MPAMPPVKIGSSCQLGLILRGHSGFAIPPGAAAIQITAYFRRADRAHGASIAQIFYAEMGKSGNNS